MSHCRVRFAPSPTGFMHLGNVRAALMNYLFAKKHKGIFVLRIEDTDQERHVDEAVDRITQDLAWLSLSFNEGPYWQSKRQDLYQNYLEEMAAHHFVYRCFCSKELLDQLREEQKAAGKPPRYDRRCAILSASVISRKVDHGLPFIWRFKLPYEHTFELLDLAKGRVTFDMAHFSDPALTREDGSFTFLFSNFVDDVLMRISHVIRGEDHLSNTALQLAMYRAIGHEAPTFWHLPLICNQEGVKLSKRDFGFNLEDLKKAGYLPEAVTNYLALLGKSFTQEIMSLEELVSMYDFSHVGSGATVRYDAEKLAWVNEQWIQRLSPHELAVRVESFLRPLLIAHNQEYVSIEHNQKEKLIELVRPGVQTIQELAHQMLFYWIIPEYSQEKINQILSSSDLALIKELFNTIHTQDYSSAELFIAALKDAGLKIGCKPKLLFVVIRYLLTGQEKGLSIQELATLFSLQEITTRITLFLKKIDQ